MKRTASAATNHTVSEVLWPACMPQHLWLLKGVGHVVNSLTDLGLLWTRQEHQVGFVCRQCVVADSVVASARLVW